jgi:hypothetical protein
MKSLTAIGGLSVGEDSGLSFSTQGYYVAGDAGGSNYIVKTAAEAATDGDVIDGYGNHTLANGNVAILDVSFRSNIKCLGAKGDGQSSDASHNSAVLDAARELNKGLGSRHIYAPAGNYYVNQNFQIGRSLGNDYDAFKFLGDGDGTRFTVAGDGVSFLDLNCALYCEFTSFRIDLEGTNQIAIDINSDYVDTDPSVSYGQFNRFVNVRVEAPTAPAGTLSLRLDRTLTNVFYGCWFLRTYIGIRFGDATDADPVDGSHFANANNFYGCEVRSNSSAYAGTPDNRLIIHNSGVGNVWHAGVLENSNKAMLMNGGVFVIDGTYIEGIADGSFIITYGGELTVRNTYWNSNTIWMRTASKLNFIGNNLDYSSGTNPFIRNYPLIQFTADDVFELNCSDNILMKSDIELYRQFEWRDPSTSVWTPLTNYNKINANGADSKFLLRLATPKLNVTGDGTFYKLDWNTTDRFYDLNSEIDFANDQFVVKQDGYYTFNASISLSGITGSRPVTMNLVTTSRKYRMFSGDVALSSGFTSVNGTVNGVRLFKNEFVYVEIYVSGGAKDVDIDVGGSDAQTFFNGHKL